MEYREQGPKLPSEVQALIHSLGEALNERVMGCQYGYEVVQRLRDMGYEVTLSLEVNVSSTTPKPKPTVRSTNGRLLLSNKDKEMLKSMHIDWKGGE